VVLVARPGGGKQARPVHEAVTTMPSTLDAVQVELWEQARDFRDRNTHAAADYGTLRSGLTEQGGFWKAAWCGDRACEARVTEDTRATIRVLPLRPEEPEGACAVCGATGVERATWGRAY
jgi:prolyl-tRNA synthetase